MTTPSIAVIGAGASGTLLCLHLARQTPGTRVTLIERSAPFGPGIAYATANPNHLLNVPAGRMSAFADRPRHFLDWLERQPEQILDGVRPSDAGFVPRRLYGAYLRHLLGAALPAPSLLRDEVVAIEAAARPVVLRLSSGHVVSADMVVLATGNDRPVAPDVPGLTVSPAWRQDPWAADAFDDLDPRAPVLLIGTGLTMVDAVIALLDRGHVGPIQAVSRRGLLPRRHAPAAAPAMQPPPFGDLHALVRYVRRQTAAAEDWRSAIDALRPSTPDLWRSLPLAHRRRFLRHVRPWWDVHRHRMPAVAADRIDAARARGQLRVLAGRLLACDAEVVRLRVAGGEATALRVARVVNCTGPCTDVTRSGDSLLQAMLHEGLARPDPCHLGLDVTGTGALRDRHGVAASNLFALGPLTRGAFWEITAIPDIRRQCEALALHLAACLHGRVRQGDGLAAYA